MGHRPSQCSDVVNVTVNERKGESQIQEDTVKRKRKKSVCYLKRKMLHLFSFMYLSNCPVCVSLICIQQFASRLQMTEDELVLHFYQFDGKLLSLLCVWCYSG